MPVDAAAHSLEADNARELRRLGNRDQRVKVKTTNGATVTGYVAQVSSTNAFAVIDKTHVPLFTVTSIEAVL